MFVLFYVLFVCKCVLLPPGDNPIAVKYMISYHHHNIIFVYPGMNPRFLSRIGVSVSWGLSYPFVPVGF